MRRILALLFTLAVLLVLGVVYYALDPGSSAFFPRCGFLTLTGYKCPGCGSQRAIHSLLHGDVAAAFKYNAMLFISAPFLVVWVYAETQRLRNPRRYARLQSTTLVCLFLIAVLLWWLLRNIFNW